MRPEPARAEDLAAIVALLREHRLPCEDLRQGHLANFLVLRAGAAVAGVAGLEPHGTNGLLRSVAVSAGSRKQGHGAGLVSAIEARGRSLRLAGLYLLTTEAAGYFERRGYRRISRDRAPAAIQASTEFSALCPASAVCMVKLL